MSYLNGLSLEEKDLFNDSITSDVYKVYTKILVKIHADIAESVLKYSLQDLSEKSMGELAILKAKADGAALMLSRFQSLRQLSKTKKD